MAYTDLWRCKKCGSMPEIVMMGKNFLVQCKTCNSDKVNTYADNLDEVVKEWNRINDPTRRGLWQRLRGMFGEK
jgi:hypothetical protein